MRTAKGRLLGVTAAALVTAASPSAAADGPHEGTVRTTRPAQVVPAAPGVRVRPIFSTGDVLGGYQMTGIPDGLGAYSDGKHSLSVLMNHELGGSKPAGVGARVSKLRVDSRSLGVRAAEHVVDGSEGFARFCSASLAMLGGTPWYFTGEEGTGNGANTPNPSDGIGHGGSSIAVNGETGNWTETRHFGLFAHENVVPVKGLSTALVLSGEDGDPRGNRSQLYAYSAPTFADAVAGEGQLRVWKADSQGDGEPSTNDIHKGQRLSGSFVPVTQAENASAASLESAAQAKGAFDFVRVEDAAPAVGRPGRLYFTDTGKAGAETQKGRLYRLDIDPSDPARATLRVVLDGDAGDDIVNPDNLDTSGRAIVIQEDRNEEYRSASAPGGGYGRVLVYDLRTRTVRTVARPATIGGEPGDWETSGVINARGLLGRGWWLLDVQAHTATAPQPGPTLAPNSSTGEDGQLDAVRIPRT